MNNNTMNLTIGVDLGDRCHQICILSYMGKVKESCSVLNTRESLESYFKLYVGATVAMEAGAQSQWISYLLENLGMNVMIGNPRRLRMIWSNERKHDARDAEMLARIARFDPELLSPIEHRSIDIQYDLNQIKARDILVRSRINMINFVKGVLKQYGIKFSGCGTLSFHNQVPEVVPEELEASLCPVIENIAHLSEQIRRYDRQINALCERKYPETRSLSRIHGVGNLTALSFILTLGNPERFIKSRDVGAYLGLVPRRDQSGETEKQLKITKAGNPFLRRLLVGSAQYVLGPFGEECDLRRYGERISQRGGKNAKRRAVVAVARKLAVLMHALWRNGKEYDPQRYNQKQIAAV